MAEKKGFFARLREGLSKTRGNLTNRVDELVESTGIIDEDFYEDLTDILIMSDAGVKATDAIIDELKARVKKQNVKSADRAREMLKEILVEAKPLPLASFPFGFRILAAR